MADRPSILVPVRVLAGERVEAGVVDLLSNARVVLLGYHVLPEQTAPGQARMQFEDRAQNRLDDLESRFSDAGATVETRLAFTHDREQTIERIAAETGAVGTLLLNPAAVMDDVLVAVRGDVALDRIVAVVGGLLAGSATNVTPFHVARDDARPARTSSRRRGPPSRNAASTTTASTRGSKRADGRSERSSTPRRGTTRS